LVKRDGAVPATGSRFPRRAKPLRPKYPQISPPLIFLFSMRFVSYQRKVGDWSFPEQKQFYFVCICCAYEVPHWREVLPLWRLGEPDSNRQRRRYQRGQYPQECSCFLCNERLEHNSPQGGLRGTVCAVYSSRYSRLVRCTGTSLRATTLHVALSSTIH
jgi:hypothetical protein